MATPFDYGLTPASVTAIAIAVMALWLAMWVAHWWRASRNRRLP